jgi:hypothetical protein
VSDADVRRFMRIEAMIERIIDKTPLPEGFDAGPDYTPSSEDKGRNRHRKGKGNRPQNTSTPKAATGEQPRNKKRRFRGNRGGGNTQGAAGGN